MLSFSLVLRFKNSGPSSPAIELKSFRHFFVDLVLLGIGCCCWSLVGEGFVGGFVGRVLVVAGVAEVVCSCREGWFWER